MTNLFTKIDETAFGGKKEEDEDELERKIKE